MEVAEVVILLTAIVALPTVLWLMWREDFEGMRSEWRYRREVRTRERISREAFFARFYKSSGIDKNTVFRLLHLHAQVWEVEPELIRPHDNYPRIYDGMVDVGQFLIGFESEFGFTIPEEHMPTIDGSFDSLVRYAADRLSESRTLNSEP